MIKKIDFSKIKENTDNKSLSDENLNSSEEEVNFEPRMETNLVEETITNNSIDANMDKHLCFRLGQELFSVPLEVIQEVIELSEFTRIPHVPEYIRGLINLRGAVITVIDLRLKLGKIEESIDNKRQTCIIISKIGDLRIGFIVDQAMEVLRIGTEELKPVDLRAGSQKIAKYVDGVTQYKDKGIILVLNLSKIISDEEFNLILEKT